MRELWTELGASMRETRTNAGMSLRRAETVSGRGRGVLSQVETGKARPNRQLVEWYDAQFGADGLLMSMFVEARTGHASDGPLGVEPRPRSEATGKDEVDDQFEVIVNMPPAGSLVGAGHTVVIGWTLANVGDATWTGRSLRRVGAQAGARVLASAAGISVPTCAPGEKADLEVAVRTPNYSSTYVAYWQMVDAAGVPCLGLVPLSIVLTVRS